MPTYINNIGIVKDGVKGLPLNLSNARKKTWSQIQQMSTAEKKGVIICEDIPLGQGMRIDSDEVAYGDGSVKDALDGLTANGIDNYTDIKAYTSSDMFTVPSDGYIQLGAKNNGIIVGRICSSDGTARLEMSVTKNTDASNMLTDSVFVRKGMKYYTAGTAGVGVEQARYFPIS